MSAPSDRPASRPQPVAVSRPQPPAFSRPLVVDEVPDDCMTIEITADIAECTAVAGEIDLPGIQALAATCKISRLHGGGLQVTGAVRARITQICVVSLEPFESDVTQPIAITFAPATPPLPERHGKRRNERDELRRAVEMRAIPIPVPVGDVDVDAPDPIVDGRIDLGGVTVEFLTLALDFYPKKPGVEFSDVVAGDVEDVRPSAFAALERFKDQS